MPEEMSETTLENVAFQSRQDQTLMEDPAERFVCDSCQ